MKTKKEKQKGALERLEKSLSSLEASNSDFKREERIARMKKEIEILKERVYHAY